MESYCSLCTLGTIHRPFFVTILIIDKINKEQWVDFKLENVLISLHSLKTMGLGFTSGHIDHTKMPLFELVINSDIDLDNWQLLYVLYIELAICDSIFLKTMGLGSIIFKEWRVTRTFSYTYISFLMKLIMYCNI
jgi:hypothetical protein